jgi:hypothetical protein
LSFLIVWESMLPGDDEEAAWSAAEMFEDSRVVQYWDPDRASGIAYSRDVFPGAWRELLDHLPDDSPIRSHIERGADADPARRPMWDFAAFYPAGTRWNGTPPSPDSFVRQLAMFKTEDGSTGAFLVTDSFAKPPIESDWFDEVRVKMASCSAVMSLTSHHPCPWPHWPTVPPPSARDSTPPPTGPAS